MKDIMEMFICEWCGKDVMMNPTTEDELDYITIHGPGEPQMIPLCRSCFITGYQGLMFAKEVVQDCQTDGKTQGRRIYVAVERVSQQNELVNALVWPTTPLGEHARSAKKNSIIYRVPQGL